MIDLMWQIKQDSSAQVRTVLNGSTESILRLDMYDATAWTGEQWGRFYAATELLSGSDENPGTLYSIDVRVLEELVGKPAHYCADDETYNTVGDSDMRESYKRVVVSVGDGWVLVVL